MMFCISEWTHIIHNIISEFKISSLVGQFRAAWRASRRGFWSRSRIEIVKSSKRSSYRLVDHFLWSYMLPKVFTTIPGQVPKQWEASDIHILEASGSSLTHTYKQNWAKNCMKIGFWRIFLKLKKLQNAHPTGPWVIFYGHVCFQKCSLLS